MIVGPFAWPEIYVLNDLGLCEGLTRKNCSFKLCLEILIAVETGFCFVRYINSGFGQVQPVDSTVKLRGQFRDQKLEPRAHSRVPLLGDPTLSNWLTFTGIVILPDQAHPHIPGLA